MSIGIEDPGFSMLPGNCFVSICSTPSPSQVPIPYLGLCHRILGAVDFQEPRPRGSCTGVWAMRWKLVCSSGRTLEGSLWAAWSLCLFTWSLAEQVIYWCLCDILCHLCPWDWVEAILGDERQRFQQRPHPVSQLLLNLPAFMIYTQTYNSPWSYSGTFQYCSCYTLCNPKYCLHFLFLFWKCCTALLMLCMQTCCACKHAVHANMPPTSHSYNLYLQEKLRALCFRAKLGNLWNYVILGKGK